jgi:O-antigen/teichoic acid export membrane protein
MQKSKVYSAIKITRFLADVSLNVWFLLGLRWGVQGLLVSNLITHVAMATFLYIVFVRPQGLAFSWSILKRMVGYGLPLALVQICLFVINFSDRFFLQAYTDFTQVGIYALAYKFGIMMNTLVVSNFFQIWQAKSFEVANEPDAEEFFRRVFTYLVYGLFAFGLAISMIAKDLITLVAPPSYSAAAPLVPLIVLAYLLHGLGTYFELGLKLRDRTRVLGVILFGSCVLCIGLYWLVYWVSQKVYPLRFEFMRMIWVAAVSAGALALRLLLPPLPLPLSIAAGLGTLAAYGAVMYLWVLRADERASIVSIAKRVFPSAGRAATDTPAG